MNNKNQAGSRMCAMWILAVALLPASAFAQVLKITGSHQSSEFTLEQLKARLPPHTVRVNDGMYGKQKEFDAFRLSDVLTMARAAGTPVGSMLLFMANDGYMAHMPAKDVSDDAYLTYKEHGLARGFEPIVRHGRTLELGPYYLVWSGAAAGERPSPYQLIEIEIVTDFDLKFANLSPKPPASPTVQRGFRLFEKECMRCHSINTLGGKVGPELNVPKNVTEYFDKEVMRQYIRSPESIRDGAKMPPLGLSDDDIGALVAYLEAMKSQKVLSAR